jgi:DNA-directed RNA polymerase subunit omega
MARITVEDCLKQQGVNRFLLCTLAWKRVKSMRAGSKPTIDNVENKEIVLALREIAQGNVRFMSEEEAKAAQQTRRDNEELANKEKAIQTTSLHRQEGSPLFPPSNIGSAAREVSSDDGYMPTDFESREKSKRTSDLQSLEDLFKVPESLDDKGEEEVE